MKYTMAIDDTDDLQSYSTGIIAENLKDILKENLNCNCSAVVRHQLLLDKRIRYTSHNSAMSFQIESDKEIYNDIIALSIKFIKENHAETSDPGLCVASELSLESKQELIEFGFTAKKEVIQIEAAYKLAQKLNIHLSEHGGTGEGVIGALAAVGLRLSGNDGKFRSTSKIHINSEEMSVKTLLKSGEIDLVCDINGAEVNKSEYIHIKDRIKRIIKDNKAVLLVKKIKVDDKELWVNYSIQELKDLSL